MAVRAIPGTFIRMKNNDETFIVDGDVITPSKTFAPTEFQALEYVPDPEGIRFFIDRIQIDSEGVVYGLNMGSYRVLEVEFLSAEVLEQLGLVG